MKHFYLLSFLLFILPITSHSQNTDVYKFWSLQSDTDNSMYQHFKQMAFDLLDERSAHLAGLESSQDWTIRQLEIKEKLNELLGPFPEKTPLNPVITGKLEKEGMVIEKLYFESYPGYYVTSIFAYPKDFTGKLPTIIFCSGHTTEGFRAEGYQTMVFNYVKKGFAVLAFDPIGQGERIQYLDESGKPRMGATKEHSYPGLQSFLAGRSPAHYFVWDGIRAVDYLETRSEVDMNRIGITGRSGGGTQSAYIAAMDDRIYAAAPECYLTSFRDLMNSRGPQDAEQNIKYSIANGLDIGDYLTVRAPKPSLMVTTTSDIFSIHGARTLFKENQRAYEALGAKDHIQMIEDDAGHASTVKNRERTYAFFRKHLKNPGSSKDEEINHFPMEDLWVFPTGNVWRDKGGEDMQSLTKKYFLAEKQKDQVVEPDPSVKFLKYLRETIGYQTGVSYETIFSGREQLETYSLEKYLLSENRIKNIPLVWLKPKAQSTGIVLYLDEKGKGHAVNEEVKVKALVDAGYEVVAVDLSGIGENGGKYPGGDARIQDVAANVWFASILVNRPILGMRLEEIGAVLSFIQEQNPNDLPIDAWSTGSLGAELLHAKTIFSEWKGLAVLDQALYAYADLITHREYKAKFIFSGVVGASVVYDLPDLVTLLDPSEYLLMDLRTGLDTPLLTAESTMAKNQIKAYQRLGVEILDPKSEQAKVTAFLSKNN